MLQSRNQSKELIIVTLNYKMLIDIFDLNKKVDLNKKSHDFCQPWQNLSNSVTCKNSSNKHINISNIYNKNSHFLVSAMCLEVDRTLHALKEFFIGYKKDTVAVSNRTAKSCIKCKITSLCEYKL